MKKTNTKVTFTKTQFLTVVYMVFTLFGFLMLFDPKISMITISFCMSICSIIFGTVSLVSYLLTDASKNMDQYGFTIGVLFIVLGICAFFRAKDIADYFITIIGIILVISSSIKLQYAVDLKVLSDKIWKLFLLIALIIGACAIIVLIYPFSESKNQSLFTYVVLTTDGIISLIGLLYLSIRLKTYTKKNSDDIPKNNIDTTSTEDLSNKDKN